MEFAYYCTSIRHLFVMKNANVGWRRQIAKTCPSSSIEAESQRSWPAALAEDSGKSSTTVSQSSINIVGINNNPDIK